MALRLIQEFNFHSSAAWTWFVSSLKLLVHLEPIHAIGIVEFVRPVDEPLLLYLALYRCAVLGSAVLAAWPLDDGEVENFSPADPPATARA